MLVYVSTLASTLACSSHLVCSQTLSSFRSDLQLDLSPSPVLLGGPFPNSALGETKG